MVLKVKSCSCTISLKLSLKLQVGKLVRNVFPFLDNFNNVKVLEMYFKHCEKEQGVLKISRINLYTRF